MAIVVDSDNEIYRGGERILFPRDGHHEPSAFLTGFDENDEIAFGRFDAQGRLKVNSSLTLSGGLGADMKARDALNVEQFVQVVVDPITSRYALLTSDPRFSFTGGMLNVNTGFVPITSGLNKFGTATVVPVTPTVIVTYTVPVGATLNIGNMNVWGDVDAEWVLTVDGNQVGGTRTSPSKLSEDVRYFVTIQAVSGSVVQIQGMHYSDVPRVLKANLQGTYS